MADKVRIDKWLWSVRIFKSRTIASDACKSGKVRIGESSVKPSYLAIVGETVHVRKNGFNMVYKIVKLIEKRVGSPIAVECYEDLTSDEELNKYKDWYVGKASAEKREKGSGRPTKRDRRTLDRYKDS
ncbi:MAG: S4 domain-containing protein [Bacteroidota bacterium]